MLLRPSKTLIHDGKVGVCILITFYKLTGKFLHTIRLEYGIDIVQLQTTHPTDPCELRVIHSMPALWQDLIITHRRERPLPPHVRANNC